ncbi:MAG: quinone-dependent dihydroorotate dehydrogenase [Bacteroidota bacterium]
MDWMYHSLFRPLLFKQNAEEAHDLALKIAHSTHQHPFLQELVKWMYDTVDQNLEQSFWGLTFKNPIGLAAGFDKNARTPKAMQALGFGFVEIGSITAQPSAGNTKPRAFRLPKDESIINRMGLNNDGASVICDRLKQLDLDIPLGVNIAKTNDGSIHGQAALDDYLFSYELAQSVSDYITINISCPNTGEGKTFEDPATLNQLLTHLEVTRTDRTPTLIKFSIDTGFDQLKTLISICEDHHIDGYVATNTSSKRLGLKTSNQQLDMIGNGGLSGKAITKKSTEVVEFIRNNIPDERPLIGLGGIDSAQSAQEKLDAGANLLQLYTGLIFRGPGVVSDIKKGIRLP